MVDISTIDEAFRIQICFFLSAVDAIENWIINFLKEKKKLPIFD